MDKINNTPVGIVGGLLVLCTASVDKSAKRIAFTPTRLFNPDQPTQDWRGIKVASEAPFYLEARDNAALEQLEQQFQTGHEYGMQVGPVPANITGGEQHSSHR